MMKTSRSGHLRSKNPRLAMALVLVGLLSSLPAAPRAPSSLERVTSSQAEGAAQTELGELTASDGAPFDSFAQAVAMDGDTIVAGAPGDEGSVGSVYVFVEPPGGWGSATESAKLTPSDGVAGDRFGQAVAIADNVIVVGAPFHGGGGTVYVFVKPELGWADANETAKLTAFDAAVGDRFGAAVSSTAGLVLVGAPTADPATVFDQGAAYLYVEPAGGWTDTDENAKLTASDGASGNNFGNAVAVSGNVVAVAARNHSGSRGAAYIFEPPAGGWVDASENAKLTASDASEGDQFGGSVAMNGDVLAVGAAFDDVAGSVNRGSAYVFVRPPGGWIDASENAKLIASDGAASDHFGTAISVTNRRIVAGAPGAEVATVFNSGAAYLYLEPADGWADATQTLKLVPETGEQGDELGFGVSASGTNSVTGARGLGSVSGIGSAFVYGPADGCNLQPIFDGLETVKNPTGRSCGALELAWSAGSPNCGSSLVYNVYRSTDPQFDPAPDTLLASCLDSPTFVDTSAPAGSVYHYAVRAEDDSGNGTGLCGGGNEDNNFRRVRGLATPAVVVSFDDDLERGAGNWTPLGLGGDEPWFLVDSDSHSPSHAWFAASSVFCHKILRLAVPLDILGNPTYLEFYHRYNTEAGYDGAFLEYSLEEDAPVSHDILDGSLIAFSGAAGERPPPPASDLPPIPANPDRFVVGGYDTVLASDHILLELRNRPAWSGTNGDEFTPVRVDLSDFAGREVTFQWKHRCDQGIQVEGWFVDDVRVHFGTDCTGLIFADGFESGDLSAWESIPD